MKTLTKVFLLALTIGFFACKDTKKEKEVTEEMVALNIHGVYGERADLASGIKKKYKARTPAK